MPDGLAAPIIDPLVILRAIGQAPISGFKAVFWPAMIVAVIALVSNRTRRHVSARAVTV